LTRPITGGRERAFYHVWELLHTDQTASSLFVRSLLKLQNDMKKEKPAYENFVGTSAATMANII
jgi:hypothetical protein